ncbi:MAG: FTR1 family protein [Archangium sp.]|nr:FTR1 family protein [Archangium sp.]
MQLAALLLLLSATPETTERWHRVVGLLEYLEGDYANAIATGDRAELEEQGGFADEIVSQLQNSGADGAAYLERAKAIQAAIVAGKQPPEVTPLCGALARAIVLDQALERSPRRIPSLDEGQKNFAAACASCHGATGKADTELAKTLEPPPANFHDAERMRTLTPYKVFNTTSFGIPGTAMVGFQALPEDTRWAQAFYVFTLRQSACDHVPPQVNIAELATSTDVELAAKYGENEIACLRRVLPRPEKEPLQVAQAGLDRALELHAKGDLDGARQAVVDAYLQGLEPVEPLLRSRDPELVAQLEAAFTRTRVAAQRNQFFESEVLATRVLLQKAEQSQSSSSFWSVFITALLILLREGFEAVVVVGALLAVLKKMGATQQANVVHAGWASSLVVGALAFLFAHKFFAGANREWMESVVSLVAVGFLLYAAMWLNARANMSKFMGELRGEMTKAISAGSTAGLFFIAFSSVGRESLETALFLQGLAIDSPDGVMWGAGAGVIALLGLVAMVRTVGFKLPMKTLFSASTVLLVVTAVVLLGKGIHGLQELAVVPLQPVPFVQIDTLGIFPDLFSLLPQLALALSPLVFKWWEKRRVTTAPGPTAT